MMRRKSPAGPSNSPYTPASIHRPPATAVADEPPGLTPLLVFRDLDAAAHFFSVSLGFDLVHLHEPVQEFGGAYAVLFPGVRMILASAADLAPAAARAFHTAPKGTGVRLRIQVTDVDVLYKEYRARRIAGLSEPVVRAGGKKEFTLVEPNEKYTFVFTGTAPHHA